MTSCEPDRPRGPGPDEVFRAEEDGRPYGALSGTALRTLEVIAEALGTTTALLSGSAPPNPRCDGPASLVEAGTLLRAFIRIGDPVARQRCLAFVLAVSAEDADA